MDTAPRRPIIQVEDVTHTYPNGTQALKGISLSIERGEIVGVIGQNGSGKTTLVKHFNGLLRPTSGKVIIDGRDVSREPTSRLARTVGYVFQNPDHQIFSNTVWEEVVFGPKNIGLPPDEVERNAEHALRQMDLLEFKQMHPMRLSRGRRQRLAIASVLAMRPPVMILDEPTGGMDREQVRRLRTVLDELHAGGHTIILVTHDLEVLAEVCTRAIVLCQGELLLDGTPREVFRHQEELRRTFIQPPQISRLSMALGFPEVALSVEEAAAHLLKQPEGQRAGTDRLSAS